MAKKDEKEFSYGTSSLPNGEKKYSVIRWGWNGLNRTDDVDTGQLTDMGGVMCDPPYIVPQKKAIEWDDLQTGIPYYKSYDSEHGTHEIIRVNGTPISVFGFDASLYLVWEYYDTTDTKYHTCITVYTLYQTLETPVIFTWELGLHDESTADQQRMLVQFNLVNKDPHSTGTDSGNIAEYTYDRKILVYPDCYSVDYYEYMWGRSVGDLFNTVANPIPESEFAAVFGSRVFGATENAVFASAFNSYVDYALDTADDVSSAHAWWSMAQSNTEADGAVTALVSYDNHVVVFRKDFMQLVYNNKNPFRVVDVGKFGCDSNRAWTILNGVLYFASRDKVYAFTGGTPKEISKKLEAGDLTGAVLGSYRDTVWMQTKDGMYTYKDGVWSALGNTPWGGAYRKVVQFAALDYGLAALVDNDPGSAHPTYSLMFLDWDTGAMPYITEPEEWEPEYAGTWWFLTDLMALGKLDVRRVKKISMLCEGQAGAKISVYLYPDDDRHLVNYPNYLVGTLSFDARGKKILRVLTRQFSSTMHRLYFVGEKYVKIYAAEMKVAWGGDVYADG